MAAPAAVLSILVRANTGAATTGLIRLNQQLDVTEKKSHKVARAMETVAKGVALVGAGGAVAGIVYATKKAAEFEQQMSSLGAVSDASAKQMERFRKQALKAGADTKFSALEAAQAQTELAKGGLRVAQIAKGGLRSALALAAAGEMELADAAEATVNAMKLFGLRGKDAMKVADGFATAANKTTADVADFAMALKMGGSAAKAAGLSFVETTAALEALAEMGIRNSDAGTSLKSALVQIAAPTEKQAKATKALGLAFFDSEGNMKSLTKVSAMLRDKLGGLTNEQRLAAAKTVAGTDGLRALLALYDAGPRKIQRFQDDLQKSGSAAEVARKKQDNLAGSVEQLQGSIETLGIQVGTAFIPIIRSAADELTDLANGVGKIISRKDLTLGEKLSQSINLAKVTIQPWIDKLKVAIDHANIPDKIAAAISAATPVILKAAASAGVVAAKTFAGAFAESDIWGKLVLGGWLFSRMGGKAGFFKMGAGAGTAFGAGMATTGGAGGLLGKVKGMLPALKGIAGKLIALDVGINLIDSKGNPIAAAINTAHDLTFGIVPKVKVMSGNEKAEASIAKVAEQLDKALSGRNLTGIENITKKIRGMASEARAFGRADLGKQLDDLARSGEGKLRSLADRMQTTSRVSNQFADNIRGLRLRGSKDFDRLVQNVSFGSRQILRVGGRNSKQTQEAISNQFDIARRRVKQSMDRKIISVKQGTETLHDLAVKELGLYGISAGRVNVVLAKGTNGQMRPHARGGSINEGSAVGDSVPALLERGEYVLNRKAVSKVGHKALNSLNFGAAPRFQKGGMIDPAWDPGGELINAGISSKVGAWAKRFRANMTAGYDPGGGHVSPGHNVTGTATDLVPLSGDWDLLEKGLRLLVANGIKVLYGTNGVGMPWPNHGRGNHAHVEWGSGGGLANLPSFDGLKRVVLQGPSSVLLEAGQGALDRVHSAANSSIRGVISGGFQRGGSVLAGLNKVFPATTLGSPGAQLSVKQTRAVAEKWGGLNPGRALQAAQIARGESIFHPGIVGHDPGGTLGIGLWQITRGVQGARGKQWIDSRGGDRGMRNPKNNAEVMSIMSGKGSSWSNWYGTRFLKPFQKGVSSVFGPGGAGGAGPAKKPIQINADRVKRPKSKLLDKVKGVGIPAKLSARIGELTKDAARYAEFADRAGQLSSESETGEVTAGIVNGLTEVQWLGKQLQALFVLRNKLVRAREWVMNYRAKLTKAINKARQHLIRINKALGKKGLSRKRKRALLTDRVGTKKLITALGARKTKTGESNKNLLESLETVQGIGSPLTKLKGMPALGVLGGDIFTTQMRLRELNAPRTSVSDGAETPDTSERDSLLEQLLREANLRTAVSQKQYQVFQDMPQYAKGGIAPGPTGQALPAVIHGGEGVFTKDQMAAMGGGGNVIVNVAPGMEWLKQFIDVRFEQNSRRTSRIANRGLPGRGGGVTRG